MQPLRLDPYGRTVHLDAQRLQDLRVLVRDLQPEVDGKPAGERDEYLRSRVEMRPSKAGFAGLEELPVDAARLVCLAYQRRPRQRLQRRAARTLAERMTAADLAFAVVLVGRMAQRHVGAGALARLDDRRHSLFEARLLHPPEHLGLLVGRLLHIGEIAACRDEFVDSHPMGGREAQTSPGGAQQKIGVDRRPDRAPVPPAADGLRGAARMRKTRRREEMLELRLVIVEQPKHEPVPGARRRMAHAARYGEVVSPAEHVSQPLEMVPGPQIIVAQIGDMFARRMLDAGIVGEGLRAAPLCKIDPPDLVAEERPQHRLGVVGAAIADDQQLEILKGLRQDGMDRRQDMDAAVVGGHHDREIGHGLIV
jgi:hypothetical protein